MKQSFADMFYLYHHNDLGQLAELLGALRLARPTSPLAIDTLLAPNTGIGRWLAIQLAESEGIAANLDVELPGGWIWDLLRAVEPEASSGRHFEADCLPWHLYAALPTMAAEIGPVADYLGKPVDEVRRYQLARQLADVFDRYLVYRADMLARWENGDTPADSPGRWQAQVWRWLTHRNRLGRTHRAHILTNFIKRLATEPRLQERVKAYCPDHLYCFGLVALAPDHLRLLYALAEHIDVYFLLPNPSEAYWGDVTAGRLALNLPATDDDADALLPGEAAVEAGHPLLGALGRMARDTLRVLYSDEFAGMIEPELGELMAYDRPAPDTLLHRVQADIVTLDCSDSAQGMSTDDTSLEVHACHSALREIQVLQDQLLDRLAADDKRVAANEINAAERLAPREIIVMLPDMATYAPAIEAVFGGAPTDRYLPFGLADRARSAAHPIVTCVSALLDLPLWRWEASALLDLLAVPAVMRCFSLSAGELVAITDWVGEAGVRWGRDANHRAELGAGAFEQNSWRFGMDRLLLGVAQSDEETLVDGVAPWSDLEGGITAALGKLWRFEQTLTTAARELAEPATPGAWQIRLNHLLDVLIDPATDAPDEQRAVDGLRKIFAQFEAAEACTSDIALGHAERTISWPAARDMLRTSLESASERQPFLAGGITFCGMVPLRAVPFRMVCVLGMNDGAFPRQDTDRAFNVMFNQPRLGDRNTRDDDRLLFLQALTAAGDVFYISHIGQDVHTGESLPPSPIVGETLEFIHRYYFRDWDAKAFRQRLVHEQPMQPFSVRYFSPAEPDPRVFTYAGDWRNATRAAVGHREQAAPMLDDSTAPVGEAIEAIDLVSLKRFFDHPPKAFFRERIQLNLDIEDQQVDDDEPIALHPIAAAGLRQRLFDSADKTDMNALDTTPSPLERARGSLPPAPLSEPTYAEQAEAINTLLPIWQAWKAESTPESVDIQLDLQIDDGPMNNSAGVRISGRVAQCWPDALRRLRPGKLKTKFRLRYWIEYLAVVAAGHDVALEIAGFAPDNKSPELIRYAGSVDQASARNELANLVRLYLAGQERALAYHPELDDGYNPDQKKAFDNLSFRFKPAAFFPHHLTRDPYFTLLLGDARNPLGPDENHSPFLDAIDAVSGAMNTVVRIDPTISEAADEAAT